MLDANLEQTTISCNVTTIPCNVTTIPCNATPCGWRAIRRGAANKGRRYNRYTKTEHALDDASAGDHRLRTTEGPELLASPRFREGAGTVEQVDLAEDVGAGS